MNKKVIILYIIILYIVLRKKKPIGDSPTSVNTSGISFNSTTANVPPQFATKIYLALKKVKELYGVDFARNIERLYRLETGHFKSTQFKNGYSPGMVTTKNVFPFGWSSLERYAKENGLLPSSFSTFTIFVERDNKNFTYVKFPSIEDSFLFTSWFIKNVRNDKFGFWNSTDETIATAYENKMMQILPRITNLL